MLKHTKRMGWYDARLGVSLLMALKSAVSANERGIGAESTLN